MKSLKVCGISYADLLSARFNGLSSMNELFEKGISYSLLTDMNQRKTSKSLTPSFLQNLSKLIAKLESKTGFQSRFYFWTILIFLRSDFRKADVIHYHILHNNFFRLETLKFLSRIKPSVWTLHDLWITTGHCIQPLDCDRYGQGCGKCPALDRTLAVQRDRTRHEFHRKFKLIKELKCEYIVSTDWMKSRVQATLPIPENRLHVIPFGVDNKLFSPPTEDEAQTLREKYEIDEKTFTVFMNAHNDVIKGIEVVKQLVNAALDIEDVKFVLIDAGQIFSSNKNVISLPRASSASQIREYFSISNLVIVPSLGESFSLITLEAMSCGKPVITLKNSAAHEVTASTDFFTFEETNSTKNILEILRDSAGLKTLLENEGERNRDRALKEYSIEKHVESISSLYVALARSAHK